MKKLGLSRLWLGFSTPVKISLVLQLLALPWLFVAGAWPWVLGWLLLNHCVLFFSGTVPRSRLLGPNRTRIEAANAVALTFDDGPDPEVTPAVLDILERRACHATFFLIGNRASQHPDLVQRIVDAGHGVENHTHRHSSWFSAYSPAALQRECLAAQAAIVGAGAPHPTQFRAPAGVRSPWLEPVLQSLGLKLTSWSRRGFDTSQRDPGKVLDRLTRNLRAGEILLLHDGNAARTASGRPVVLEVLEPLLDALERLELEVMPLPPAPAEARAQSPDGSQTREAMLD